MVDWIGSDGAATAYRYRQMAADVQAAAPSYEQICLGVASDDDVVGLLDTLPPPKRQPNLLLGAVRFLGGPVSSWREFREFVLDRWDDVAATMLARRTQTNEAGRCATLLPVLAALPQPLALLEVGASAGLCLLPDRYTYSYERRAEGRSVGRGSALRALGGAPGAPTLHCAVEGPVPLPQALPEVAWRAGLDLNPLDVTDDEDVRWLRSLIWPEQTQRFATLSAAVDVARGDPPMIVEGDLVTDLAALAAQAPPDATLVVFHSAVLAYVPAEPRAAFVAQVSAIAAERPTLWLANEASGVVTHDEIAANAAAFVLTRDGVTCARSGSHGQWLSWIG